MVEIIYDYAEPSGPDTRGMMGAPDENRGPSTIKVAANVGSVGIEMGLAVAIGAVSGHWLDERFDTSPWWTIIMLVCGIGAAAKAVWRTAVATKRQMRDAADQESN